MSKEHQLEPSLKQKLAMVIATLHNNNIVHAVVKNESWELDDWFVLCHKKQLKNTN